MIFIETIVIALACFSAIPMPFVAWNERNMRLMMAAFPLVGVVVGLCMWTWCAACDAWGAGPLLRGAGLAIVPLALTGGIHMDGFADVADAQSSHASPERKRAILKDPHVGAFATMGICGYLIAFAALASELDSRYAVMLACVPVVSRCLCGIAAVRWPLAGSGGMLANVREKTDVSATTRLLVAELVLAFAVMIFGGAFGAAAGGAGSAVTDTVLASDTTAVGSVGSVMAGTGADTDVLLSGNAMIVGASALVAAGILFVWAKRFCAREFGGLSGDLVGFLLQSMELAMIACIVLVGKMV